ncbi:hypothetical protein HOY80DRAFT_1033421 [Tuber brumale]|nr:hypothetical protein HOY80DRAFT_1033421 [Tuber brumale]
MANLFSKFLVLAFVFLCAQSTNLVLLNVVSPLLSRPRPVPPSDSIDRTLSVSIGPSTADSLKGLKTCMQEMKSVGLPKGVYLRIRDTLKKDFPPPADQWMSNTLHLLGFLVLTLADRTLDHGL